MILSTLPSLFRCQCVAPVGWAESSREERPREHSRATQSTKKRKLHSNQSDLSETASQTPGRAVRRTYAELFECVSNLGGSCVSRKPNKVQSKAQVPSVLVNSSGAQICQVRWQFWVLARCTLPQSRSGVCSVYKFVRYLAVRRVPPPPTLRVVRVEAGRRRGGDRSAVIHNSARGCRFRFSFLSVPPGRSGGRPRRRAGGVEDEVTTAIRITSRLEPQHRAGPQYSAYVKR